MRLLAIPVLVLAMSQLASGAWIQLKAALAQQLIAAAWREPGTARPWPWADTHPVARLELLDHDIDLYVLAGRQGNALAFGPGHHSDSAPPGGPGITVIGGHRDTHFSFLGEVEAGDEIRLTGIQHRYRVSETRIVDSRRGPLRAAGDGLLLVTCFPFNSMRSGGPLRYLVIAKPVF